MSTARERISALFYGAERNLRDDLQTVMDKIAAEWQADKDQLAYNIEKRLALQDELQRLNDKVELRTEQLEEPL